MSTKSQTLVKKTLGIILIILGLAAIVTPFTPGGWLLFIGLEILGFRIVFKNKLSLWWKQLRRFFGL